MTKHVIEYAGLPVGIAIREQSHLRFIAVKFEVFNLDQRDFVSLDHLDGANRTHLSSDAKFAA